MSADEDTGVLQLQGTLSVHATVAGLCTWSQGVAVGCTDGTVALARSSGDAWDVRPSP